MISANEAINIIEANNRILPTIVIDTADALDYTLANDISSSINFPPFNQSAMDGYALNYKDGLSEYVIIGEVKAGDTDLNFDVNQGEGVRIYTGAKIPTDCSTVIQQEWCIETQNEIRFNHTIKDKLNFRKTGEQIKKGELALKKGTEVSPALIGYLIGIGEHQIEVISKPSVGIVITGNELAQPGEKLKDGKIFESNSFMLIAALKKYNYTKVKVYKTLDEFNQTKNSVKAAIDENDVVLISGGISVGTYDFVEQSLSEIGVEKQFYKVKQKPGKPLFYGIYNNKHIFGLPGNPGAALTCYYIYVLRLLSLISSKNYPLEKVNVCLNKEYVKKSGRSEFLKVFIKDGFAEICKFQNSSMLRAFEQANALVYVEENKKQIRPNEKVCAYLLL